MNRQKEELEKFIRRYYDSEVMISPEGRNVIMESKSSIADHLQRAIIAYMDEPLSDGDKLSEKGQLAFAFVTKVYAYGLVLPSHDLLGKLDAERKKNAELLRDLSICVANYATLERKHNRLVNLLDKNLGPDWRKTESEGENNNET